MISFGDSCHYRHGRRRFSLSMMNDDDYLRVDDKIVPRAGSARHTTIHAQENIIITIVSPL